MINLYSSIDKTAFQDKKRTTLFIKG